MKTRYFKKIFASALMVTAILGTIRALMIWILVLLILNMRPALTKMMYS